MTADLEAIRARLAAATPGPWERRQRGTWAPEVAAPNITTPRGDHAPYSPAAVVSRGEFNGNLADLDLIANAPADLAALADEVEALTARAEGAEELLATIKRRIRSGMVSCPMCQAAVRETVGMVCQVCGMDYMTGRYR